MVLTSGTASFARLALTYFDISVFAPRATFVKGLAAETFASEAVSDAASTGAADFQLKGFDAPRENSPNTRIPKIARGAVVLKTLRPGELSEASMPAKGSGASGDRTGLKMLFWSISLAALAFAGLCSARLARSVWTADTSACGKPCLALQRGGGAAVACFTSTALGSASVKGGWPVNIS